MSSPTKNVSYAEPLEPEGETRWERYIKSTKLDPLAEIASLLRSLTYGEMVALAEGIGIDAGKLHEWSTTHGPP